MVRRVIKVRYNDPANDDDSEMRIAWDGRWYVYISPGFQACEKIRDWEHRYIEENWILMNEKPFSILISQCSEESYTLKQKEGSRRWFFAVPLSPVGRSPPRDWTRVKLDAKEDGSMEFILPDDMQWINLVRHNDES